MKTARIEEKFSWRMRSVKMMVSASGAFSEQNLRTVEKYRDELKSDSKNFLIELSSKGLLFLFSSPSLRSTHRLVNLKSSENDRIWLQ